jgi:hypothetical protein
VHPGTPGEVTVELRFLFDERLHPRVNDVLFPVRIEIRERRPGDPASRRTARMTFEDGDSAGFNEDLPARLFERPRTGSGR